MTDRITVLHVTETTGSGVASVIQHYVDSSPGVEHLLLCSENRGFSIAANFREMFTYYEAAGNLADFFRSVPRIVRRFKVDVVHYHSSKAGAVGRLLHHQIPVLYTPHCFAFERDDVSRLARRLFFLVERVLANKTALIVGVSPHETQLGASFNVPAITVQNEVNFARRHPATDSSPPRVVGIGRLSAQKDPAFFAAVVTEARRAGVSAEWVWVGDGDDRYRESLERAGARVTGWLPRLDAMSMLESARVYLHTAAWEGNPVSVLEAAALGVPTVVRSIPAMTSLGHPPDVDSPSDAARLIEQTLSGNGQSGRRLVLEGAGVSIHSVYESVAGRSFRDVRLNGLGS